MSNLRRPARLGWQLVGFFVALNLFIRLPKFLAGRLPLPPTNGSAAFYWEGPLRLVSLDLFALVCLLALVPVQSDWKRYARAFAVGTVGFLLIYETYDAVIRVIFHRDPLFYSDLSHIAEAAHLLYNTISVWLVAAVVAGGSLAAYVFVWIVPWVVRRVHRLTWIPGLRWGLAGVGVVVWSLVTFAVGTGRGIERPTYQSICLSTTEVLVRNIQESWALKSRVEHRQSHPPDSTYRAYRHLNWDRPPSVYLIVVESYGTIVSRSEETKAAYSRLLGHLSSSLGDAGWHSATARSAAPVFGGLSWLSVASILLGSPVKHQPSFDVMRPAMRRYPHLVSVLDEQGYATAALQPPVRRRAGLPVENLYGFDQTLYFSDLNYQGPDYGWGIVPDQYSLSVAHRTFVEQAQRPFFLLFETVGSHVPLDRRPPPLVQDAEALNLSREAAAQRTQDSTSSASLPWTETPQSRPRRLLHHLGYTWEVIADYLTSRAPKNSLAVVIGDHQPYFAEGPPTVPVHVVSKDTALTREFLRNGFRDGLRLSPAADTLRHAGLYSLLVRAISARRHQARQHQIEKGRFASGLPPYLPGGVLRAALLPDKKAGASQKSDR